MKSSTKQNMIYWRSYLNHWSLYLVLALMINSCCTLPQLYAETLQKIPQNNQKCGQGMVFGDPHFKTLDQVYYSYHGRGEFVLLASHNTNFKVHIRLEGQTRRSKITLVSGIAIQLGKDSIKYYAKNSPFFSSNKNRVRVNGKKIKPRQKKIKLALGTLYQAPNHYVLETNNGERVYWDRVSRFMNVKVKACGFSNYHGLLMPKGKVDSQGQRKSKYKAAASKYFRGHKKSKMLFTPRGNNSNPQKRKAKNRIPRKKAASICQKQKVSSALMDQCIFDVALTGNVAFARNAVKLSKDPIKWVKEYALSDMSVKQWRRKLRKRLPSLKKLKKQLRSLLKSKKWLKKAKRNQKMPDRLKKFIK
jgi:hypothetical protein